MFLRNKLTFQLGLLGMMFLMSSAHAGLISTDEALKADARTQIVQTLERQDVQQQFISLGVDPASALARVNTMTDTEISQLNGRLADLPAGAGVSTVDLLLIIIIILLI